MSNKGIIETWEPSNESIAKQTDLKLSQGQIIQYN